MNEELDSQLSAMFDDELSSAECELLARRLSRDGDLTARWGRYAVIGAAIRAERGVRLNARVARAVSVLVRSEPALGDQSRRLGAAVGWWRPVAGAAVAAGVAAVSILWLRSQAPDGGMTGSAPLTAAVPVTGAAAPVTTACLTGDGSCGSSAGQAASYIVPPPPRGPVAIVPATELANYVVAHSMYAQPVARGNLLSSFVTNETGAAGGAPAPLEPSQDRQRDAQSRAQ